MKKLNTKQLMVLRQGLGHPDGSLGSTDRCTLKALRDRGLAVEVGDVFFITPAGRDRAKRKADCLAKSTYEGPRDETLMQDLPE